MQSNTIQQLAGNTDIYLLDQIMKDRYGRSDIVLDAGCGNGRNLHCFLNNQIYFYENNLVSLVIEALKIKYSFLPEVRLRTAKAEQLSFANNFFDYIISCAVLHVAKSF